MNNPHGPTGNSGSAAGIALLVIGVLSLLFSGYFAYSTNHALSNPEALEQIREQWDKSMAKQDEGLSEEEKKQKDEVLAKIGDPIELFKTWVKYTMIFSMVGVVLSGFMILGGFGLMKGSKGLGLLGGLAAMVPQWCCLIGVPIGIWAIVASMKIGKPTSGDFK